MPVKEMNIPGSLGFTNIVEVREYLGKLSTTGYVDGLLSILEPWYKRLVGTAGPEEAGHPGLWVLQ